MAKTPKFTTVKLSVKDRIATLTLNRPERLNAINDEMPGEIRAAVAAANADDPRNRSWTRPSGRRCGALARRDEAAGCCPQRGATPPACKGHEGAPSWPSAAQSGA